MTTYSITPTPLVASPVVKDAVERLASWMSDVELACAADLLAELVEERETELCHICGAPTRPSFLSNQPTCDADHEAFRAREAALHCRPECDVLAETV